MGRNRFTNPVDDDYYDWQRNHSEEEEAGKTRNVNKGPSTGNTGLIRTQGDDTGFQLRLRGFIVHRAQYKEMWEWFKLSRTQTIYFTDFDGQKYEVQITAFVPRRVRKLTSISPDSGMRSSYWEYSIEMEVFRFLDGDLDDAGVTP